MKRIFAIIMISLTTIGIQASNTKNDPTSEAKIEIAPVVENNYLSIEVDEQLSGTKVTVSVFSATGEIVLESTLGLGLNKIDVEKLQTGNYVAVVRENGEYASKQSFVVG